jgi:hypothetical protein
MCGSRHRSTLHSSPRSFADDGWDGMLMKKRLLRLEIRELCGYIECADRVIDQVSPFEPRQISLQPSFEFSRRRDLSADEQEC